MRKLSLFTSCILLAAGITVACGSEVNTDGNGAPSGDATANGASPSDTSGPFRPGTGTITPGVFSDSGVATVVDAGTSSDSDSGVVTTGDDDSGATSDPDSGSNDASSGTKADSGDGSCHDLRSDKENHCHSCE